MSNCLSTVSRLSYNSIYLFVLYPLMPRWHPLSGTAQKGEKEAAKMGFNWRIVIIITIRPVPVLLAHPLILEFLPPSAEKLLYHGYTNCGLWRLGLRSRPRDRKRPCTARPLLCAIRGQWTTAESYPLRFNLNAHVLKSIPAKKGELHGGILSP